MQVAMQDTSGVPVPVPKDKDLERIDRMFEKALARSREELEAVREKMTRVKRLPGR